MQCEFRRRARLLACGGAAWLGAGVLAACGASGGADQGRVPTVDELSTHDGDVCPRRLPQNDGDDSDFGAGQPAESSPSLAPPESAWVCRYDPVEVGQDNRRGGATLRWQRAAGPYRVQPQASADLQGYLRDLSPIDPARVCTMDLGPRWMVVQANAGDLTGVVVDDYGCREVRLTDEPFENPPGSAAQPGTVAGVLEAPDGFLNYLKSIGRR